MRYFIILFVVPLATLASKELSAEAEQLHQQHCLGCHQVELYQSPDTAIKTLQQLRSQVLFCSVTSGSEWFDDEVDEVTNYLNANYYLLGIK